MIIRDSFATINGDKVTATIPSDQFEIIGEDGRTLFRVRLCKDAIMEVSSGGGICKHGGKFFTDRLLIEPIGSNAINIHKPEYK